MATKVKTSIRTNAIICLPLTFGYMLDIENGIVEENKLDVIKDGTDLTEDEIRKLRVPEATTLWKAIQKETYPELYDENGELKKFDETFDTDDKKKV